MRRYSWLIIGLLCFYGTEVAVWAEDYHLNVNGMAARQYSEAVQEDMGHLVLSPDVERTAALRRAYQFRTFVYHGRKAETVTIKVRSVQFAPEVFLRNAGDDTVAEELNSNGRHEVNIKQALAYEGDYHIRIRAKGAGQGVFQVVVHSEMPNPEQKASDKTSTISLPENSSK